MSKFQRLRSVTLPVLKLEKDQTRYLYFVGAMHLGKKIDDQKEAATIAHVIDMDTGEEGQLICGAVLVKELDENYPGSAYVHRGFEITISRVPEKRYNIYSIAEVSIPDDIAAALPGAETPAATPAATPIKGKKVA